MYHTTKLLTLLLCIISMSVIGQEKEAGSHAFFNGLDFGAKAGVNFSTMFGDVGDNSFLFFVHAGLVIDKSLDSEWALSFEPHFSGEGQMLNGGYDRIIYLNLPFLGKYPIANGFTVDGGVHLGVKVTERTKFSNGDTENRNRFKRIAPGLTAGATYDVNNDWFLQFRTNLKLSDVVRKEGGDSEGSTILTFQISIGRRFN
ncbi:MAG: outer membrane beta-barrel protein [Bacteroidota bacterium]